MEDTRGEEESRREQWGWGRLQARGPGRRFGAGLGRVGSPSTGASPPSACTQGTVWSRRLALKTHLPMPEPQARARPCAQTVSQTQSTRLTCLISPFLLPHRTQHPYPNWNGYVPSKGNTWERAEAEISDTKVGCRNAHTLFKGNLRHCRNRSIGSNLWWHDLGLRGVPLMLNRA